MIIGLPKEIKPQEYRIALTPEAVTTLVEQGHTVLVQKNAGLGCGFPDILFQKAGAQLISNAKEVWKKAEMIIKVKEPLPKEYPFFRPNLILFTFLHLASEPKLISALRKKGVTAIGYETITDQNGFLPLLKPMSQIAGKLSVLLGADYLRTDEGKKGILLSHVEGTRRGRVTILGGGNAGKSALEVAIGIGAEVILIDSNEQKLEQIKQNYPKHLLTFPYNPIQLENILLETDLLIGAVLIPGAKAPKLVTRAMISRMQPHSVVIDISVDQGGCIETTRRTTHADPIFTYKEIIHYGVPNMPSLVAKSATEALSHQVLPYALKLANYGLEGVENDSHFKQGIQIQRKEIVYPEIKNLV